MLTALNYNIHYDISALIVLFVCAVLYVSRKNLPTLQNRYFLALVFSTLFTALFDIFWCIAITNPKKFSVATINAINVIYFFVSSLVPLFYALYAKALSTQSYLIKRTTFAFLNLLPFFISLFTIFASPFLGLAFYIDAHGNYSRKNGLFIIYAVAFYYLCFATITFLRATKTIPMRKKVAASLLALAALLCVIVQHFVPSLLVIAFALSICLLLMLITIQNADEHIDSITGRFNQNAFMVMAELNLTRRKRFSVVSIILDDMPILNKAYGIKNMNYVASQIGTFLANFAPKKMVYHIRKRVFTLILHERDIKKRDEIVNDILERFKEGWTVDFLNIPVSVHVFIVECPVDASTPDQIVELISIASEKPKYYDNRVITPAMIDTKHHQRQEYVEQAVKLAIQENRLFVYYQPIYSSAKKRIVAAEALIRLVGPDGIKISPEEFIPIAEKNGSIMRIGQFVLDSVCRFFAFNQLHSLGIEMIDVNLSMVQCMQTNLAEQIIQTTKLFNLSPSSINLEITETAAIDTPQPLLVNMMELRNAGFSFSLDDYGTGYATANYVLNLPFSIVKLDKGLIQDRYGDARATILLKSTIEMMKELGLEIIAEGVENEAMAKTLIGFGADYLQGFHFAPPLSEADFLQLLQDQAQFFANTAQTKDASFFEVG